MRGARRVDLYLRDVWLRHGQCGNLEIRKETGSISTTISANYKILTHTKYILASLEVMNKPLSMYDCHGLGRWLNGSIYKTRSCGQLGSSSGTFRTV